MGVGLSLSRRLGDWVGKRPYSLYVMEKKVSPASIPPEGDGPNLVVELTKEHGIERGRVPIALVSINKNRRPISS